MSHLASILVLLLKIQATKSCAGVSLKTQELYAIVFLTRYLDLFTNFVSLYVEWNRWKGETQNRRSGTNAVKQRLTAKLASDATDTYCWIFRSYNTIMKLIFIGSALAIIWLMRRHKVVRQSYDKSQDTFRYEFLLAPCFLLSLVLNNMFTVMEVLWTFSIYLEAVAILPQMVLLQRTRNVDNLTGNYVFLLGAYRALYILNWIYRYYTEPGYRQWLVWLSGIVQTAVYCDFFYYYIQSWKNNEKLQLPA
uniref:ER lumen protein-retaining receptor n=2 Tax=Picocystis salinarum TaxID=88271 RepID=A0A7S3UAX2_9CHLO|mmetsp:Transcript_9340/g.56921  ORF Transcript_9340/g.56921 Transcript_9340/m.56921 type:complete len:250 (-) Transcript_9340:241-990(-)